MEKVFEAKSGVVHRMKEWLMRVFAKKHTAWIVLAKDKDEYCRDESENAYFVAGWLFESKDDALKHVLHLKENTERFGSFGIEKIKTGLPICYTKLDYNVSEDHPSPTATFKRAE